MKAQNLNNSSRKTRKTIKKVFAEMLSEKMELGKISVSELCKRAEISRGTFYSHYDDIYGVAEDYENELINRFYDDIKLSGLTDIEKTVDSFFEYIRENEENYKKLCRSNDFLFAAKKLTDLSSNKFLELCHQDKTIRDKSFLATDISVFVEGILCEYVKYCRGYSTIGLNELYLYTKDWLKRFRERRCSVPGLA